MFVPVTWHHQDPLHLTEDEWLPLIKDPLIVNEDGRRMLAYLYSQPDHQSSATEIGQALGGVSQQKVTAWNRRIAREVYKRLGRELPKNLKGGHRFWNALLDGDPNSEKNAYGYFIWRLRPSVVAALKRSGIV
ncbi:hypothetical protein [Marinicrinis lubricantis]|uniref:Helix-turn-helix domain-containing protein n=1 Tax=Marinicrinis lubricantis TaxID=2086470 RepID=A0ABW1IPU8_9BACL